jgi:hypothetical protein
MPRIVDELGNELPLTTQSSDHVNLELDRSVAWAMDPVAPVPEGYQHLVPNPNKDNTTDEQKEEQ